jgi:hypothetical protein
MAHERWRYGAFAIGGFSCGAKILWGDGVMEWQPIETAPKEIGVEYLVWRKGWCYPSIGSMDGEGIIFAPDSGDDFFHPPTHWMPLPEPPK